MHCLEPALSGEVGGTRSDVHLFSIDGVHLAYDGASGALHRLSPVGRDTLEWAISHPETVGQEAPADLLRELSARPETEVRESWNEIRYLYGKTIFAGDSTMESAIREKSDRSALEAGLKAMCLDVAHDCNLACSYCFASTGNFGGRPHLMTKEAGRASIDFLIAGSKSRKYLDVDFFGGEPLMSFDVVKDVVRYAREKGKERGKEFRFTLTTNCTLLDESKVAFLNDQGISLILSIDGRPRVHNAQRRFRDGRPSHAQAIEKARQAAISRGGKDYYIRGTYTKANLDFDADIRYLYEQGFRKLSLEPAVGDPEDGRSISEPDLPALRESYLRTVKFWHRCAQAGDPFEFYHFNLGLSGGLCRERRITGCGAGYEYVAVTPTGEAYPCHQLVGKHEFLLGDVKNGMTRFDMMEAFHAARIPSKPACQACWARYLCGGGCHARAIAAGNPLTQPDPLSCHIMRTRLEFALYAQTLRV
ncbi:MAG: thioether cross-link-forming SCIFF peptide maturase [Bacillota bacterium]